MICNKTTARQTNQQGLLNILIQMPKGRTRFLMQKANKVRAIYFSRGMLFHRANAVTEKA